ACPQATRTVPAAGSAMCAFAPGAQPASESPLRLESAAIVLPQIAAGQSATVNLPVKIRVFVDFLAQWFRKHEAG
ncbi:MAG TPA: hypothetical protein PLF73_06265, partial [Luteimonas sp.]|nr:hypothetical protein [Luteimonas sp.]